MLLYFTFFSGSHLVHVTGGCVCVKGSETLGCGYVWLKIVLSSELALTLDITYLYAVPAEWTNERTSTWYLMWNMRSDCAEYEYHRALCVCIRAPFMRIIAETFFFSLFSASLFSFVSVCDVRLWGFRGQRNGWRVRYVPLKFDRANILCHAVGAVRGAGACTAENIFIGTHKHERWISIIKQRVALCGWLWKAIQNMLGCNMNKGASATSTWNIQKYSTSCSP